MHHRFFTLLATLVSVPLLFAQAALVFADDYDFQAFGGPSQYSVSVVNYTCFDVARGRSVPVRIYYPAARSNANADLEQFPIILFSTSLGCGRDDCAYLGRQRYT